MDYAFLTDAGGRSVNEDFVTVAKYNEQRCYILCDGLGGHGCGDVASSAVASHAAKLFEEKGDYPGFIDDAYNMSQNMLLDMQQEDEAQRDMKTTMVILVVSDEQIKWAHIGDSRLYHIFNNGEKYERTRDHSVVQLMADMGEIKEADIRKHADRNKILRALGGEWAKKSYDKSAILERDSSKHAFALMSDGFWENIEDEEILALQKTSDSCDAWLKSMEQIVRQRADMSNADNYSAICVRVG